MHMEMTQSFFPNQQVMSVSGFEEVMCDVPSPAGPAHFHLPSYHMMLQHQQLGYPGFPPGYLVPPPPQYWAPYIPHSPQCPVMNGSAGFYPSQQHCPSQPPQPHLPQYFPDFHPAMVYPIRRHGPLPAGAFPPAAPDAVYPSNTPICPSVSAAAQEAPAMMEEPQVDPMLPETEPGKVEASAEVQTNEEEEADGLVSAVKAATPQAQDAAPRSATCSAPQPKSALDETTEPQEGEKPNGPSANEELKTQEVLQRLRTIVNTLTPERFQELTRQVTELEINTEERLKGAVSIIFEKAISVTRFSAIYAKMCSYLMGLEVPTSDNSGAVVFCKLLVNCCQKEFERDQEKDHALEQKQGQLEASRNVEEQSSLKVALEQTRARALSRSLGNITFICELFKLRVLSETVLHSCVTKLLHNPENEASLECLYRLLLIIGKDLDSQNAKPQMDYYFNLMAQMIKDRKTSPRICLMFEDVLELRKNNWVTGRRDLGPKTTIAPSPLIQVTTSDSLHCNNAASVPAGGKPVRLTWAQVCRGDTRPKPAGDLQPTASVFSAESDRSAAQRPSSGQEHGGDAEMERVGQGATTEPQETNTGDADGGPEPALTKEELEKKTNAIIEEYLHVNDLKAAMQRVAELNSASLLHVFVRTAVGSTLACSRVARENVGLLLQQLIKARTLPTQQYYKGLEEILEVAEDMAVDIPHLWLYLAELLTPMLREGGLPMGQLFREISKSLVPRGKAASLLVEILNLLCKEMTPEKISATWTAAKLSWSDFFPKNGDVGKFVTERKVDFTMA